MSRVDERVEIAGIDADVRGVESRVERFGAAEDLDLTFFSHRRRVEVHFAASHEHHRRDPKVHVGHEDGPFDEREVDVLRADRQVVCVELFCRG